MGRTMKLFSIVVAGLLMAAPASAKETSVADFTLQDYRGKSVSLNDYKDKPIVVLAFLGVECPLAKQYGARLGNLARDYESKGIAFIGIDSNSQDSITQLAAFVRQHQLEFPVLKGLGNQVADKLSVKRTPEVLVLDKDRVIRYSGRVDDQFGIGFVKDKPVRHDLRVALDELLEGKPVSVAKTESTGCLIGRVRDPKAGAT